jgi:hypothetical protein
MSEQNPEPQKDTRMETTGAIWGMATGMLALSIPLSSVTQTAFIPLIVIAGAAIGTVAVWRGGAKNESPKGNKEQLAAQQRIAELEERLANLETINNFERRLAEEALKRHDASALGQVMPDEQSEMATTTNSPQTQRAGT